MFLKIRPPKTKIDEDNIQKLPKAPDKISISRNIKMGNEKMIPLVKEDQEVTRGEKIGECKFFYTHSPVNGKVLTITDDLIEISNRKDESKQEDSVDLNSLLHKDYKAFLKEIGLVGMGGSTFPAYLKTDLTKKIDTLIINSVECEPHISIDQKLLLEFPEFIKTGAESVAEAIGAKKIKIALRNGDKEYIRKLKEIYSFDLILLSDEYPAGAERLILKKVLGKVPSQGIFPIQLGFLIHNTASIWSVGRAIKENLPVISRPLTLNILEKGISKNIIVPLGTEVSDILSMYGYKSKEGDLIIAGGLMMGRLVDLDHCIGKGDNSIFVMPGEAYSKLEEKDCINCGNCFDICPLGLHPSTMVERLKKDLPINANLRVQLDECFLCGACSYICPSKINFIKYFTEAKKKK